MISICALLEFTIPGHTETYKPEGLSSSERCGYESPESWKPSKDAIYPDGTPVMDIKEVLEEDAGLAFSAPLLTLADPFKDNPVVGEAIRRFSSQSWNLRKCGLQEYMAYWEGNGARFGSIVKGRIVWDQTGEAA